MGDGLTAALFLNLQFDEWMNDQLYVLAALVRGNSLRYKFDLVGLQS